MPVTDDYEADCPRCCLPVILVQTRRGAVLAEHEMQQFSEAGWQRCPGTGRAPDGR